VCEYCSVGISFDFFADVSSVFAGCPPTTDCLARARRALVEVDMLCLRLWLTESEDSIYFFKETVERWLEISGRVLLLFLRVSIRF